MGFKYMYNGIELGISHSMFSINYVHYSLLLSHLILTKKLIKYLVQIYKEPCYPNYTSSQMSEFILKQNFFNPKIMLFLLCWEWEGISEQKHVGIRMKTFMVLYWRINFAYLRIWGR